MKHADQKYNFSHVTDIDGLAECLCTTRACLRNKGIWRDFPHVFVGAGKDLRSARFIVDDVLEHLKKLRGKIMGVMRDKKTGKWMYKFVHKGKRYRKKGFQIRDHAIQAEGRKREEVSAPRIQIPSASYQQL